MQPAGWTSKPINNLLLDINGVLFESGETHPIAGSVDALKKLVDHGFKFCLATNECTQSRPRLAKHLNDFGFEAVTPELIVSPAPVACRYVAQQGLVPWLHVWDDIKEEFRPALDKVSPGAAPNCLVVGDVMGKLSRDFVDESLEIMLNCDQEPVIVALGGGRYYRDSGKLRMDTGAHVAAFEHSLGVKAITFGKPNEAFFQEAINVVGGLVQDTVMIGDDVRSDVGGAKLLGMRGFLVRTGKYKKGDESRVEIAPDDVFDNLQQAVDCIIEKVGSPKMRNC